MPLIYRIIHTTSYHYSQPVSIGHNEARLTPRSGEHQRLVRSQLLIEPAVGTLEQDVDYFGNVVHHFALEEAHSLLTVTAISEVELAPCRPPASGLTQPWEVVRDHVRRERSLDALRAYELTFESPLVKFDVEASSYALQSFRPGRPLLEAALELSRRIHDEFEYRPGSTTVATPLSEVLQTRRGVCQDFAHLQIAMLRSLGLPARYVSGYVYNRSSANQPGLVGADASHAWLAAYCPSFGYIDLDPTNGLIPADEHVTLAFGRDFADASPLKGVILGGGRHVLHVGVQVSKLEPGSRGG